MADNQNSRGLFIVLEGIDRAGKSTQCDKLKEALNKERPVELRKFPDRSTSIGKLLDDFLRREVSLDPHAAHLLFAANLWEGAAKIEQLLAGGTTVIADRYAYSGVAYRAGLEAFTIPWCKAPHAGLPKPDVVFYLKLDPMVAYKRRDFGKEQYENIDTQRVVARIFDKLNEEEGGWVVVCARKSEDEMHAQIAAHVEKLAPKAESPLKRLA